MSGVPPEVVEDRVARLARMGELEARRDELREQARAAIKRARAAPVRLQPKARSEARRLLNSLQDVEDSLRDLDGWDDA